MTSIEWTASTDGTAGKTWNPIVGCSRVSAGCEHCYAERVAHRGMSAEHKGLTVVGTKGPRWAGEVRFLPERLALPLSWRKPRRVFVNSMSDLFHESVPFETIAAIFGVMAASPRHTFQVLTKRPARALEWFRWATDPAQALFDGLMRDAFGDDELATNVANVVNGFSRWKSQPDDGRPLDGSRRLWPLPNVWLGVSVEDQASADARIPLLLETPAAVRWVSYEPALGPVDFDKPRCDICGEAADCVGGDGATPFCNEHEQECSYGHWLDPLNGGLNWVVVGGESGPGARPFDLAWARSVIAQAKGTGCRVFVKQLGAKPIADDANMRGLRFGQLDPSDYGHGDDHVRVRFDDRKGGDPNEWPEDLRVREWPEVRHG